MVLDDQLRLQSTDPYDCFLLGLTVVVVSAGGSTRRTHGSCKMAKGPGTGHKAVVAVAASPGKTVDDWPFPHDEAGPYTQAGATTSRPPMP